MIYLVCSAATPLYKRDALETLSYPCHHIFRFRYDRQYVQPEIRENAHCYEGKNGVLVFADSSGAPGKMDFNFYPVRLITTLRLTPIASAIYVDFRLGEFVNYGPNDERRISWDQYLKTLANRPWPRPDMSGRGQDPQGYFLVSADPDPKGLPVESHLPFESWQSVVQHLDGTNDLAGSTFYLIQGFYRVSRSAGCNRYSEVRLPSTDNEHDSVYPVPMGSSVVLKVLFSRPTFDYADPAARRALKITAGGEAFSGLSKDTLYSESRYNEERITLICKRVFDTALSTVAIEESAEPEVRTPRATLLVRIKVPTWIVGAVILGVVFTTALLALDSETVRFVSTLAPASWATTLSCNAKTIAAIAKGLSPLPVGFSAYLAFRRLPIK